jgi:hypothetical protein
VQFKVDGLPAGAPAVLQNGVATVANLILPHGIHAIGAEYVGDGNFYGSTNGSFLMEVINTPPVAGFASYSRVMDSPLQIKISELLTNHVSDPDGDNLTLVGVGSGTNGASISISGDSIWYYPSATNPNRNATDYLDYRVADGFSGGVATNQIQITISGPDPAANPPVLNEIIAMPGQVIIRMTGVPNCTYHLERAAGLAGASTIWNEIGTVVTDSNGRAEYPDASPLPGLGFYRATWHR